MEEVVAGGGCGQVIGRLVLYSERLRPVARADWFLSLRVFPCMLHNSPSATGLQPVLTGRHQSFRQRALDKTWHHGHANPCAPPDPPLRRHPTSAPPAPPCPADATVLVPVPTDNMALSPLVKPGTLKQSGVVSSGSTTTRAAPRK